ncbi:MAG: alpha/beta hydrolase-fold protein [Henriciella sp.]|nr:alpha/beta hydrolase-fold protein [Henriciella sp.]
MNRFRTIEISNPAYTPPNIHFITVQAPALGRRGDMLVYCDPSTAPDAPVIILLHGVYGSAWAWLFAGGVHTVYERLRAQEGLSEFVLVMPSDGLAEDGSGYFNRDDAQYRNWIVEDVRSAALNVFASVTDQSRVYLTGLSMGGYGALRLGALHPDVFTAMSAHSPITRLGDFDHFTQDPPNRALQEDAQTLDLIPLLTSDPDRLPPFRFDCGRSDILFKSCQSLSQGLRAAGMAHQFDTPGGGHDWTYWHENIARSFRFFDQIERAI